MDYDHLDWNMVVIKVSVEFIASIFNPEDDRKIIWRYNPQLIKMFWNKEFCSFGVLK
jgi:hypothetical protein